MLKLLAYETPHESCFWVFGESNAKYLTFDTPNRNALSQCNTYYQLIIWYCFVCNLLIT